MTNSKLWRYRWYISTVTAFATLAVIYALSGLVDVIKFLAVMGMLFGVDFAQARGWVPKGFGYNLVASLIGLTAIISIFILFRSIEHVW